jgi:pSer/pThr/pTyr-binding forkhead associated (FHA) protein
VADPQESQTERIRVTALEPAASRLAMPFRPTTRPPVALLTVCDDGKTDSEVIRIRNPRFVIGRTEGDLCIPIDGRISSRHVEISLQAIGGTPRWVVTDLQSTHGLYVRVSRVLLADEAEFLVGGGRYEFDARQHAPGISADEPGFSRTHGWPDAATTGRPPTLTELLGAEIGNRVLLTNPEYWIGSDPTCAFHRPHDPFCEPRHVRLYRKPSGAWHAENNKSPNGLWVRMSQITVDAMVQFQIGEQRFRLRVN